MSGKAAVFAGQGAQAPGMGKDLFDTYPACAELFREADDILGYKLSEVCFNGPAEELTRTNVCQPAIFVVSAACLTALKEERGGFDFDVAAGLSLGEWTALWAAGAVSFGETVRILEARGRFMQEACDAQPSGMVSVLKVKADVAERIAAETGCGVSNYNSPEQTVLSGTLEQVAKAAEAAAACGARAVPLQVAGAYHSRFMSPAAEKLAEVLAGARISEPSVPVLSNFTGKPHGGADEIRSAMLSQITGSVRWVDDVMWMFDNGDRTFAEFGPGRVLTGLVKRIVPDGGNTVLVNVSSVDQVKNAAL